MSSKSAPISQPGKGPAVLTGLFVLATASTPLLAQTSLGVGDIQVTGVTSDTPDSFSFVLWKNIESGTVIRFMDQSFTTATTGVVGTENDMSLTFSSGLSAGTVVYVANSGTTLVNGGTFSGTKTGSLSGISNDGDQVFAYQGAAMASGTSFSGRTLLYGFNVANTNWVTSGTSAQASFLPTAINGIDANIDSGNFDNADYTGSRTGMTTAAYRAAIGNIANFTQNDTYSALATGGFTSTGSVALHWDANGTTANNGGTGTWDATTQSRFKNGASGTTYLHWVNSSTGNDHTAVFGGTAGTVTVSGGVTASGMQFDVNGYTIQSGTVTLAGSTPTIQVTTAAHSATVSSILSGSNGLTKSGAGTLIISGANNYTGGTTVSAGTLQIGDGAATGTLGGGAVTNHGSLVFNRSNNFSVSTTITGSGTVTKEGDGTMTLLGINNYTGTTTINDGTLAVDGTASGSAFTVNNGGILGGDGTTGALTVANGGRVGPGNSAGSLDTGNFNLQAGGILEIELNGTSAGTGYDQINISGSATLSGLLSLTLNHAPAANSLFHILTNDGSDAVTGTFTGLANQSTFNISGQDFKISYFADSTSNSFTGGNDIALMAVPEPMAALLGGFGWVALLGRRRR